MAIMTIFNYSWRRQHTWRRWTSKLRNFSTGVQPVASSGLYNAVQYAAVTHIATAPAVDDRAQDSIVLKWSRSYHRLNTFGDPLCSLTNRMITKIVLYQKLPIIKMKQKSNLAKFQLLRVRHSPNWKCAINIKMQHHTFFCKMNNEGNWKF